MPQADGFGSRDKSFSFIEITACRFQDFTRRAAPDTVQAAQPPTSLDPKLRTM